jgi:hypothetical protein
MSRDFVAAPAAVHMSGQVRTRDSIIALVGAIETVQGGFGVPAREPPECNRAMGASACGRVGHTATEDRNNVQNQLQLSLRATAMAPIVPLVADRRPVVSRGRFP